MVIICNQAYTSKCYDNFFKEYPFALSDFQKYAIDGIIEDKNILITAHTGSGKTLPAEFAIRYFTSKGKKVIYTSPIKALSNQKFHEFKQKFPDISIGILTGDIKFNPDADVLIMTTEILRNTLFQNKINKTTNEYNDIIQFKMDIEHDLACVIFDEIHYINDSSRGKVWEETIMELPKHIQLIMLSATIQHSEKFAEWIESINNKQIYLINTIHRVVPLIHYMYSYVPDSIIKKIKDKAIQTNLLNNTNNLKVIKDNKTLFNESEYQNQYKIMKYMKQNYNTINKSAVLNNLINLLKKEKMLPAICFVFSRKLLEICANNIEFSLFNEDEAHYPLTIRHECELILKKLPNYKEYLNLPEFNFMCNLLEKGIAIHHSGIMPVLREMVELIFSKGYIKLLFATETFAVGINMPTKTVIFSNIEKYDGNNIRLLLPHEYTQMAGRAGRRGLDKIGHVIHCNNLIDMPGYAEYKNMLSGHSQTIQSKFKISYNLLLNLILNGKTNFLEEIKKSMIQNEINKEIELLQNAITSLSKKLTEYDNTFKYMKTTLDICKLYTSKKQLLSQLGNKQRKKCIKEIADIEENNKFLEKDVGVYNEYLNNYQKLEQYKHDLTATTNYLNIQINNTLDILRTNAFIVYHNDSIMLTNKGKYACNLQEIHSLALCDLLIESNYFQDYDIYALAGLFSCFTSITVDDKLKLLNPPISNNVELILNITNKMEYYFDEETKKEVDPGIEYHIHYNIIEEITDWCKAETEEECKSIINKLQTNKNIFLGEFIKAILKINNISNELEKICILDNNVELLHKLTKLSELTLKFIATNQSLYINN